MSDKSALFIAYWNLLAPTGAPAPVAEYRFDPSRKWRFDFAFLPAVAVEVDGGQFAHRGGRHATDSDREKLNRAAELGWRVFRFSPQMLENGPVGCVQQVAQALGYVMEGAA